MGSKAANTKPLHGIQTGSPMQITLGQHYNVGEMLAVIINDTLSRSLESVVTECKEHTIHTQTRVVASRKPKEIKRAHEGEANLTTQSAQKPHRTTAMLTFHGKKSGAQRPITYHRTAATDDAVAGRHAKGDSGRQ